MANSKAAPKRSVGTRGASGAACTIDHLMWAVPDLEEGISAFENASGLRAQLGGEHAALGTHNALLSLGDTCYLEIIAAKPDTPSAAPLWNMLRRLTSPVLLTFAAATSDLAKVAEGIRTLGYASQGPVSGSRNTADGQLVQWQNLIVADHPFAQAMPFFIDWRGTPHPGKASPQGARLEQLTLVSSEDAALQMAMEKLGLGVTVQRGPATGLIAEIETPRGSLTLTG